MSRQEMTLNASRDLPFLFRIREGAWFAMPDLAKVLTIVIDCPIEGLLQPAVTHYKVLHHHDRVVETVGHPYSRVL